MEGFTQKKTLEELDALSKNTLSEHLGITLTEIGANHLSGEMPITPKTMQPFGLLHGGASVALAETLGSLAAWLCIDPDTQIAVGIEINANHLKGVTKGFVKGTAKPIHLGKQLHVWGIEITNDQNELICISRLTVKVLQKK